MSQEPEQPASTPQPDDLDDTRASDSIEPGPESGAAMRSLLQRAMPKADELPERSVLPEVQRTLRVRSRGKFYGDGWSVASSRFGTAMIAVAVLLVLIVVYFAMMPGALGG